MAAKLNMLDQHSVDRITRCIAAAGLPAGRMNLAIPDVLNAMAFDKKVKNGKIRFVLPDRIGHVVIRDDVPMELVRDAVASLKD
jgi:3-dehydroquinate synthase